MYRFFFKFLRQTSGGIRGLFDLTSEHYLNNNSIETSHFYLKYMIVFELHFLVFGVSNNQY